MDTSKAYEELYNEGMVEFLGNNFDKCVMILSQAADLDNSNKLVYVSRGAAYLRLNRAEEALTDFNRAIEIDDRYARAFHLRGLVEEMRGDDTKALADLTRAIEIDPEYGAAYNSRAALHTKMGNENLAMEDVVMIQHLTGKNLESLANENNIWHSQHLRLEAAMETELER